MGIHHDPDQLVQTLRQLRRGLEISAEVSLVRDIAAKELRIFSDPGRCCRPIFIVENQARHPWRSVCASHLGCCCALPLLLLLPCPCCTVPAAQPSGSPALCAPPWLLLRACPCQALLLKKEHIHKLRHKEETGFRFSELLANGLIEFMDTEEEETVMHPGYRQCAHCFHRRLT